MGKHASKFSLYQAIVSLKDETDVAAFFEDLCSHAELESMKDRWAIVEPLLAGLSYRDVHAQTGISVTTVGRVARCLARGTGGYIETYERLGGDTSSWEVEDSESKE